MRMLDRCHILIVEDEFMLAEEMRCDLEDAGAVVFGPEPSVSRALAHIDSGLRIDAAVLDVNLGAEWVFPVADVLAAKQVPFLFVSGYEDAVVLDRYPGSIKFDKPINARMLIEALDRRLAVGHT
jgi:DNA-binding response OmpR family regulator